MYRSAVIKLTIYYVALLTCLSLVFSTTLYFVSRQELVSGLSSQTQDFDRDNDSYKDGKQIYDSVLSTRTRNLAEHVFYYDLGFIGLSIVLSSILARETLKPIRKAYDQQLKFVAEASHQLRTPLANMQLETEVALLNLNKHKNPKKLYVKSLKQNLEDIKHLSDLSSSLLGVARHQSDLTNLDKQNLDLKRIIASAIKQLENLSKQNRVNVTLDGPKAMAAVDRSTMEQAFIILIENAIKYSSNGSTVGITITRDKNSINISVIDHGIGIKKADINKIFRSFYRSTDQHTQKIYGYGLGLPLARQIIKSHGGTINVISTYGEGSTFQVKLPLKAK